MAIRPHRACDVGVDPIALLAEKKLVFRRGLRHRSRTRMRGRQWVPRRRDPEAVRRYERRKAPVLAEHGELHVAVEARSCRAERPTTIGVPFELERRVGYEVARNQRHAIDAHACPLSALDRRARVDPAQRHRVGVEGGDQQPVQNEALRVEPCGRRERNRRRQSCTFAFANAHDPFSHQCDERDHHQHTNQVHDARAPNRNECCAHLRVIHRLNSFLQAQGLAEAEARSRGKAPQGPRTHETSRLPWLILLSRWWLGSTLTRRRPRSRGIWRLFGNLVKWTIGEPFLFRLLRAVFCFICFT